MAKRTYEKGLVLCAGNCNRYLRPAYQTLEDAPGTVRRHAQGMCKYCHRRTDSKPVQRDREITRPCKACGLMTRSGGVRAADYPGTRLRIGDLCRSCDSACESVPADRLRYLEAEVEYFIRARRSRGIPPEGMKVA